MKNLIKLTSVLLLSSVAMNASTIYDVNVNGLSVPGATAVATGGTLVVGNKEGLKFLGVSGGGSGDEISMQQSITIDFFQPATFEYLTLGLLFNGPEYGDSHEVAASLTNGADEFSLVITGENIAKWYKNGNYLWDVAGIGTQNGGWGLFTIVNPFPGIVVDTLKLYPLSSNPTGNESDFGLVAFKTPDSGMTAVLLGLGLAGMAFASRRFKRA
jgi:hypothetical protein